MSELYEVAALWETISFEERGPLRKLITELVGYPCKLACKPNNGSIDIYVFSEKKRAVTDWIEIQPSGALGVIFDMYEDIDMSVLSDKCIDYNQSIDVEFESDSESESSQLDKEESEEQSVS